MRRRNIKGVMDTSVEEDEEDNAEMSGVVMTMDLGGFKASEEREKVNPSSSFAVYEGCIQFIFLCFRLEVVYTICITCSAISVYVSLSLD